MGLFNKYFGTTAQNQRTELSCEDVMKFISDSSQILDDELFLNDSDNYYEIFSSEEINHRLLREFRTNILAHMIFGFVHNKFNNINEHLVNMNSTYKETLYSKSNLTMCSKWSRNNSLIAEIINSNSNVIGSSPITIIYGYGSSLTSHLHMDLENSIAEFSEDTYQVEDMTPFKRLFFLFNNPKERHPPLEFADDYEYDMDEVDYFMNAIRTVYIKANELFKNGK